ncbi:MAG TPA: hypothetical protein DEV81_21355, partial [Cyanobacteria bacterium UBA11049]|nr:hypothetical protein [Cyanobacteria bacterium UBA11049]
PRVLTLLNFPSVVNLVHLGIIPWVCFFTIFKTKTRSKSQIAIAQAIFFGLAILLTVMVASALLNSAGAINIVVDFLLLGEPFMMLLALISIPMSLARIERFKTLLIYSGFINTLFAFVQRYALKLQTRPGLSDNIKGVFIAQGAGHVIGASVALTFGVYYFLYAKTVPIWIRTIVLFATFWHLLLADAKQVLLTLVLAWVLLLLTKFKDIQQAIKYLSVAIIVIFVLIWCVQNVPAFQAFNTWMRPEIYGPNGEATKLKLATFSLVPSYYHSPLNPLFGLGPGHTVGRLGGWMLLEYADLLQPLGSTTHPATSAVWAAVAASWLGDQSSMFSPLFGWAGIWGDLGFIGLGAYLYLWFLVWCFVCKDDFSRFLVFCVFTFGLVFSQMEEPGYMLYVVSLIGLRWQEHRYRKKN